MKKILGKFQKISLKLPLIYAKIISMNVRNSKHDEKYHKETSMIPYYVEQRVLGLWIKGKNTQKSCK